MSDLKEPKKLTTSKMEELIRFREQNPYLEEEIAYLKNLQP